MSEQFEPPTGAPVPDPPTERRGSRRWTPIALAVTFVVGLLIGFAVSGLFGGDDDGGGSVADQNAELACTTLERWDGVQQIDERGLDGHWLGYAVAGPAVAAAVEDERYEDMREPGNGVLEGMTRMDLELLGDSLDSLAAACEEHGF